VKAFRDGSVVAEFVGAQPKPVVQRFIEGLVPNESDLLTAAGRRALAEGDTDKAETFFRQVLASDARHAGASLGLAQIMVRRGDLAEGLATLLNIQPDSPSWSEASALRTEVELRQELAGTDEGTLTARIAADPGDLEARYQLAGLLTLEKRYTEAMDEYLEVIRRDRGFKEGAARRRMLHIFELLGEVPIARTYRNKLASVLFA
jgi:putative thioredoxin